MTRPPRTDRYRCPIGSKPRVKRPGSEFDPVRPGRVKKTDGPGGNGPIPTIQSDGSNDPPAIQADPAPDPVTPISAHGGVKWSADGRVKKSRIRIDPTAGRGSKRRRMPRRGLPPHLEAMMFGPSRVPHPERSKDGKGPIRSWAFRTGPGHTGEPMPAPDPISAGRRSFTWVKTRGPGPDMIRAETMHPGCPFLPEPGTRPSRNQQNRKSQTQRNQDKGKHRKTDQAERTRKTSTHTTTKPEKPEDQKKTPKPTNQKTQHHQTTTMRVLHPPRWGTPRTAPFVGRVTCLDGFSPDIATNRMGIRVGWAWMAVKNRPCARPAAGP